jgi:hypothetical protein
MRATPAKAAEYRTPTAPGPAVDATTDAGGLEVAVDGGA